MGFHVTLGLHDKNTYKSWVVDAVLARLGGVGQKNAEHGASTGQSTYAR